MGSVLIVDFPEDFEERYNKYCERFVAPPRAKKTNYEALDYEDDTLRREWEKRWEAIKVLHSVYLASGLPNPLVIPVKNFIVGIVPDIVQAEVFFGTFQNEGCFQSFHKSDNNVVFDSVNYDTLLTAYEETKTIYGKFATAYKEKKKVASTKVVTAEVEESGGVVGRTLVEKNNKGVYLYNCLQIKISKDITAYKVFDILFTKHEQTGFLSYKDIESELIDRGLPALENDRQRNKRINNAISKGQGFFRYAKVNGKVLENKTLKEDEKLVDIVRGKGLKLNNPHIAM